MLGYWEKEAETSNALKKGYLYTGDIATMDKDGYFTIVDRKKDMIIVSGFNVYPNEIEEQIAAVPGVNEVGVIGMPDEKTGEAVVAYVVAGLPAPTEEQIIAHCKKSLSAYKAPKKVVFVDELPKSPIGKILRRELRSGAIEKSKATTGKGA
jgi:long-chain acyl-CoA synthetase